MTCPTCGKEVVRGVCGCGRRDIRDLKKLEPQFRTVAIERAAVKEDSRIVPLAFSSETPVERWWGFEILDHSPGAMRTTRLKSGAPLLSDHIRQAQIGKVETVAVGADRVGRADVRFGKSDRAEQEYQDVLDEIRTNVSVGYIVHAMVLEKEVDGVCTYRVTDWEPFEISLVSIPADINVGVGRDKTTWEEMTINITVATSEVTQETGADPEAATDGGAAEETEVTDPNNSPTEERTMPERDVKVVQTEAREAALAEERTRVREINAIAGKHPALAETAREFVESGKSLEEFRTVALERLGGKPVVTTAVLGMGERDLQQYSILRAINQITTTGRLDGVEREASEATAKVCKREAKGFFIPQDIMQSQFARSQEFTRTMQAGVASAGGYTVGQQLMVSDMIELLRNKTLVATMGARNLSGLVGNVAIPRQVGGATAYWLPENGDVTLSDQAFGQLGLVPRRLVGATGYSKELIIQSSLDVESFVREDLMRVLAIEKDRAAINGAGANGEPLGILNTTGIGTVTFGGAATWAKVVSFETAVANANADVGQMGYIATPNVRGAWKTAVKVTNQAFFLWEGGDQPGSGRVNTYRAEATKQVPSDKVIFGNFNDLILADWSGIDVVVDPYSLSGKGIVKITITLWTDTGVRHAGSFCVSTDSGAQ